MNEINNDILSQKSRGASLLLLCRNIEKMSSAASKILESTPDARILQIRVDLADVRTVSNAVKEIKEKQLMIDVLVLNAGLAYFAPTENLYNINSIQVVNHYSHFFLLNELLSNLKGSEEDPARVIALASDAHNGATGDGRFWKTYSSSQEMASVLGTGIKKIGINAYCESKLANILHMREMATRYPQIKFMSVHPGVVNTNFFSFKKGDDFKGTFLGWFINTWIIRSFLSKIAKSSDQGAQTSMYCICSPEAETSLYYKDCAKGEVKIKGKQNLDEAQEQLWNLSLKFVQDNCENYCFI